MKPRKHSEIHLFRNILGSLLVAEEFDGRVGDNPSTIGTISLKQSSEALSSPDILQALYCSTVLNVMWILDLNRHTAYRSVLVCEY